MVEVEGDISHGLPSLSIVGMGGRTVSESKDRVKSAIKSSGFSFPPEKYTINLAPADLHKDGSYLDLPIALAILRLSEQLSDQDVANKLFVGELSLNGELRPVSGIINLVETAKKHGITEIFLPYKNVAQASLVDGVNLIGIRSLSELYLYLKHQLDIDSLQRDTIVVKNTNTEVQSPIFDHIHGQELAKRALSIAVAGHHNILLSGPPGTGKTLLSKAALNLLPPLSKSEQISVTKLHSIAGASDSIIKSRPFRTPHHTCSPASLIGGSAKALPGEISLAHLGVLFLDELPEYPRNSLEALRQPLEDRQVTVTRTNVKATYPANFMLIATMNPCPCGFLGDKLHACTCTDSEIKSYQKRLSGPLLDRIDLFVTVDRIKSSELTQKSQNSGEHSVVKNTITDAISRQHRRYQDNITSNSDLTSHQINTLLQISSPAKELLNTASDALGLSTRSYFKTIKVAQTIADLAGSSKINPEHINEALSFRHNFSF